MPPVQKSCPNHLNDWLGFLYASYYIVLFAALMTLASNEPQWISSVMVLCVTALHFSFALFLSATLGVQTVKDRYSPPGWAFVALLGDTCYMTALVLSILDLADPVKIEIAVGALVLAGLGNSVCMLIRYVKTKQQYRW